MGGRRHGTGNRPTRLVWSIKKHEHVTLSISFQNTKRFITAIILKQNVQWHRDIKRPLSPRRSLLSWMAGYPKIHELLEVQGVSANSANDRGIRPMHIACQCGNMPLVHRLLELGESSKHQFPEGVLPKLLNLSRPFTIPDSRVVLVLFLPSSSSGPIRPESKILWS